LVDSLAKEISICARKYLEINKAFPENIIIYRDGVGEGEITAMLM